MPASLQTMPTAEQMAVIKEKVEGGAEDPLDQPKILKK